jgi:hypothetical protein
MAVRGTVLRSPLKRRALAFVVFGISLVVIKLCLYDPIAAAERHEPSVSFSLRNAMLAPFFFFTGVFLIAMSFLPADTVARLNAAATNPETKRMSPKALATAAVLAFLCFGIALWAQTHIHNCGYDV